MTPEAPIDEDRLARLTTQHEAAVTLLLEAATERAVLTKEKAELLAQIRALTNASISLENELQARERERRSSKILFRPAEWFSFWTTRRPPADTSSKEKSS